MTSRLPINLDALLHRRHVEGERIEFKAGWNPDAVVRTLVAFANDFENLGGGYIVLGQDCDADGVPVFPPVGLPARQLDKIQREILQVCQSIQPPYFPIVSVEEYQGRNLVVLWAPGGPTRPYKGPREVTAKRKDYRYFLRRYSSTIEAKGEDERELIRLAATVPFDDRLNQRARVEDLDRRLMVEHLEAVGSDLATNARDLPIEELGRSLNVVDGPPEATHPRNVGLLFFTERPDRFFPVTQIDVVYFPDGPGGDRFEEKTFRGPLARMTRDALSHIERHYLKQTVVKYPDRAEADRSWNFPFPAIEEAVVNAVYHRSYEIREPIEVRITPEELMVVSYPGPDRSVRMEELRTGRVGRRRYRNRRIGEFLKELELTEGRSTGIPKILRHMKANGSPPPAFETDEERTSFAVCLPVHPDTLRTDSATDAGYVAGHVTGQDTGPSGAPSRVSEGEVTGEVTGEVAGEVTGEVEALLRTIEEDASRVEIQVALGLQSEENFRVRYLVPALALGLIERTIPDKPRSRNQRYRLSPAGQRWLAAHPRRRKR